MIEEILLFVEFYRSVSDRDLIFVYRNVLVKSAIFFLGAVCE